MCTVLEHKQEYGFGLRLDNACCEKLPVSGAAPKRQASVRQNSESSAWYRQFVSSTSQTNWKFYVFSLIIDSLFDSYCDKLARPTLLLAAIAPL
ncbi:unnamed protein product [Dibothriocephalus latus]|uniref:Uncharacterized protein n=1 Tax=Dibothriocephalus latus TaxID=60516 RepID=A0A3P7M6M2_DIBLA|nr:unnamed protein product [Dibothriocephalus latus]